MNTARTGLALALLVALGLAGCGPGVGGTGGGEAPKSSPDLCGTALAAALNCPNPAGGPGTGPVHLAEGLPTSAHRAELAGNDITLFADCEGLRFDGAWNASISTSITLAFQGQVSAGGAAQAATLVLSVDSGGVYVLTLTDAGGKLLLGPLSLQREPVAAGAGACP